MAQGGADAALPVARCLRYWSCVHVDGGTVNCTTDADGVLPWGRDGNVMITRHLVSSRVAASTGLALAELVRQQRQKCGTDDAVATAQVDTALI